MTLRWKKHGRAGDPEHAYMADARDRMLRVARITRHTVTGRGRYRTVTKTEWRVSILEVDPNNRALMRARLDVPRGCYRWLDAAKAGAQLELDRIAAREQHAGATS